ncbi:DUF339-domain-containing protein [Tilletiaria anomala UBC 951]|uniref:Succinate dehydrogenase assembly factor 2, mitochondrial n=1 Tax=Tilletiaria anomala (strain ATCC 24038 / CBS 436.72 / UBC 951) TaxID=1037660 RepID=A0A066VRJ4_TILAU|nr:DUF339-domain-containing protein [Tilletiaria anomala UBC 951]KDN42868.1 DUF339-domain-containing protein [Tilletiaria anomala UBC 951]
MPAQRRVFAVAGKNASLAQPASVAASASSGSASVASPFAPLSPVYSSYSSSSSSVWPSSSSLSAATGSLPSPSPYASWSPSSPLSAAAHAGSSRSSSSYCNSSNKNAGSSLGLNLSSGLGLSGSYTRTLSARSTSVHPQSLLSSSPVFYSTRSYASSLSSSAVAAAAAVGRDQLPHTAHAPSQQYASGLSDAQRFPAAVAGSRGRSLHTASFALAHLATALPKSPFLSHSRLPTSPFSTHLSSFPSSPLLPSSSLLQQQQAATLCTSVSVNSQRKARRYSPIASSPRVRLGSFPASAPASPTPSVASSPALPARRVLHTCLPSSSSSSTSAAKEAPQQQDDKRKPSTADDPYPLPFSPELDPAAREHVNLSTDNQREAPLDAGAYPLRVPGRDGRETRTTKVARLIYQTRKRGTLETDLILSTWADKALQQLDDVELDEFDRLLDEPDWDIFYWCTARKAPPPRWHDSFHTPGRLGHRLRVHTKNEEKQGRRMPKLK